MAVELRCPGCRAKLRLPDAAEEGSEIECPKCGHVFSVDGNAGSSARRDDGESKPRKKSERDDDGDDRPKKKKTATATKTEDGGEPKKKKRRKLKKRKANRTALIAAIVGGLLVLVVFFGSIIWFFNRKSASQEMMTYLPDDCDEVSGINLGHLQKYPEFYKTCESTFLNTDSKAADAFSRHSALKRTTRSITSFRNRPRGRKPIRATVEATVLRTKTDYDTSALSKLPGA